MDDFLKYLNFFQNDQNALKKLNEKYSIRSKKLIENKNAILYCLNYDQINSPSFNVYVKLCRSLFLSYTRTDNKFNIVGRGYDRFPDLNENVVESNKIKKYFFTPLNNESVEKKDGSIVLLFNYNGEWLFTNRASLGNQKFKNTDKTFLSLISDFIPDKEILKNLNKDYTYIFEIYNQKYNHIVTRYDKPFMCLLDIRNTIHGYYLNSDLVDDVVKVLNAHTYVRNNLESKIQETQETQEIQEIQKIQRPQKYMKNSTLNEILEFLEVQYTLNPLFEGICLNSCQYVDDFHHHKYILKIKHPFYYLLHANLSTLNLSTPNINTLNLNMTNPSGPNLLNPRICIPLHILGKLQNEIQYQFLSEENIFKISEILEIYNDVFKNNLEIMEKASLYINDNKNFISLVGDSKFKHIFFKSREKNMSKETFVEKFIKNWNFEIQCVIKKIFPKNN